MAYDFFLLPGTSDCHAASSSHTLQGRPTAGSRLGIPATSRQSMTRVI